MKDDKNFALTTIDNPYSPFTQFVEWLNYDSTVKKYNTCALLARTVDQIKPFYPNSTEEEITDEAIKYIISNDYNNVYKIIYEKDTPSPV